MEVKQNVISIFNDLGHRVLAIWGSNQEDSTQNRKLLLLSEFNEKYRGFLHSNEFTIETENLLSAEKEYLIHEVIFHDREIFRLKKTKCFFLEELKAIDMLQIERKVALKFSNPQTKDEVVFSNKFTEQSSSFSFAYIILKVMIEIYSIIPEFDLPLKLMNRENEHRNFVSQLFFVIPALQEQASPEIKIPVIGENCIENRPNKKKLVARTTRKEDLELDNLLYRENMYDVKFTELDTFINNTIKETELRVIKQVNALEVKTDFQKEILHTFTVLVTAMTGVSDTFSNNTDKSSTHLQVTQKNKVWCANVISVEQELQSIISRYCLSDEVTKTLQVSNTLLASLCKENNNEKVFVIVTSLLRAFDELNASLKGENTLKFNADTKLLKTKNFLQENMHGILLQKEHLNLSKLQLVTNINFTILQIMQEVRASYEQRLLNVTFDSIENDRICEDVVDIIHSTLSKTKELVKYLPKEEYTNIKEEYLQIMTSCYAKLIKQLSSILFENIKENFNPEFLLEVRMFDVIELPESADTMSLKEQALNEIRQSISNLKTIGSNTNITSQVLHKRFEIFFSVIFNLVDNETKFLAEYLFYFEDYKSLKPSIKKIVRQTVADRKVQFGEALPSNKTLNEESEVFLLTDSFLYDLFLREIDLVHLIDFEIWSVIKKRSLYYEIIFILSYIENITKISPKKFVGREFKVFLQDMIKDLCNSWISHFFQTEKDNFGRYVKTKNTDIGTNYMKKLPLLFFALFLVNKNDSALPVLEIEFLSFIKSMVDTFINEYDTKERKRLEVILILYYLRHMFNAILTSLSTEFHFSNAFLTQFTVFSNSLSSMYLEKLAQFSVQTLFKDFRPLFNFINDVNKVLATFLTSEIQQRDLPFHIDVQEYYKVLQGLTATELDLDVIINDSKGCSCFFRRSRTTRDLIQRVKSTKDRLDDLISDDTKYLEVKEAIKEEMITTLCKNYEVFVEIANKCYNQRVNMDIVSFESTLRRHLELNL